MTGNWLFISGWGHDNTPVKKLAYAFYRDDAPLYTLPELEPGDHDDSEETYSSVLGSRIQSFDQPVVIVGWSTGGIIALETAAKYSANVAALILISATPRFCTDSDFPWGTPASELEKMQAGIENQPIRTLNAFFRRAAYPQRLPQRDRNDLVNTAINQGKDSLKTGLQYLQQVDCRDRLLKIKCPVVLMHGEKDRIIPFQAAQWLSKELKNADLYTYPEGGHDLIRQKPAVVAEMIDGRFG